MWSKKLGKDEGKKVVKPWVGPYVVKNKLGRVGYEMESEVGLKRVRVHVNRLRKIGPQVVESGEPKDDVFPDNIRLFKRIEGCEMREGMNSNQKERWFKLRIQGRRSDTWTKKSNLPDTMVMLFDGREQEDSRAKKTK